MKTKRIIAWVALFLVIFALASTMILMCNRTGHRGIHQICVNRRCNVCQVIINNVQLLKNLKISMLSVLVMISLMNALRELLANIIHFQYCDSLIFQEIRLNN